MSKQGDSQRAGDFAEDQDTTETPDGRDDGDSLEGWGVSANAQTRRQQRGNARTAHSQLGFRFDDFRRTVKAGILARSRPAEYHAVKAIYNFQRQHNIRVITLSEMTEIGSDGYYKGKKVERNVQMAAQRLVESDEDLFQTIQVTSGAYDNNGTIHPAGRGRLGLPEDPSHLDPRFPVETHVIRLRKT
jgi:hypothetical protein